MPKTDVLAEALLRIDADKDSLSSKLELLIVVNPDPEARQRIRAVLHRRLDENTKVLSFNSFREFAEYLQSQ